MIFWSIIALNLASLCPSVPTIVTVELLSSLWTLKYKPLRKYLVSSFEIANFVLSINLKRIWELIFRVVPSFSVSIIGKSSFGKDAKENLDPFALRVNNFPLFEIISISQSSSSFLTISYKIWEFIVVAPSSSTLHLIVVELSSNAFIWWKWHKS